jgi:hypothetical protein
MFWEWEDSLSMPGGNGGLRGGSSGLSIEVVGKLKDDLLIIKSGMIALAFVVTWIAIKI